MYRMNINMRVTKRDGRKEDVSFDKVINRIKSQCDMGDCDRVDPIIVAQRVCSRIYDGVNTHELDELAAQICTSLMTENIQYGLLASRIIISNNHKNTLESFTETVSLLHHAKDKNGRPVKLISDKLYNITQLNKDLIDNRIDYSRDFLFDFFGFKTLERAYLLKYNNKIAERVQHLLMRVSLGLHGENLEAAFETYDSMSNKYFIHATPTLFHSGSPRPALLSCFLLGIEDSVEGIFKCLADCAQISKYAGGIGLHISNIRAKNSIIRSTNGYTNGLVPMLKVFNDTARYINQSGKRLGSFAIYLEPWHNDIDNFLELKKNHGDDNARARDLFYALYIPDLFMRKVENDEEWHLFCPDECQLLANTYGEEFDKVYQDYVDKKMYRHEIRARDLWKQIISAQMETGTPYLLYKDSINRKSNQQNVGIIRSSNLCVAPETLVLTDTGYHQINTLCEKNINVWNGKEFSNVTVHKTGENQELIKVTMSDGTELDCTKYHKFYVQEGYISHYTKDIITHKNVKQVEAQYLREGMKIIKCNFPIIDNDKYLENAYETGYRSSTIDGFGSETFFVPINYSIKSKLEWFAGYCDANDYIIRNSNRSGYLQIENISLNFLRKVKFLLNTCGCNPKIRKLECVSLKIRKLSVNSTDLQKLLELGFNPKRLVINKHKPNRSAKKFITVESVEEKGRIDDTYCFTESKRHAGIFNGMITSQCTEIVEYSDSKEYACCTLASLGLPNYVSFANIPRPKDKVIVNSIDNCIYCKQAYNLLERYDIPYEKRVYKTKEEKVNFLKDLNETLLNETQGHHKSVKTFPQIYFDDRYIGGFESLSEFLQPEFDFKELYSKTKIVVRNLNKVIDINYYPVPETKLSNLRHRPLGLGVQGLADVYALFRIPFGSDRAKELNKKIFATIYYAAMETSMELSIKEGPYETYEGSPISKGLFQFDLWNKDPEYEITNSFRLDWDNLRENIKKFGVRNSLLLAPMPTASTSQILGNNECIEPFTSNIYVRRTLSGDFLVLNKYLLRDLQDLGLWSKEMKDIIILCNGSIQKIDNIPNNLKRIYKTAWDMTQKDIIDQSADRGIYVCQSQSLNLFVREPTLTNLSSMHFYTWKKGLKTGLYYLRTRPVAVAQQFTVDPELVKKFKDKIDNPGDYQDNYVVCESCSG